MKPAEIDWQIIRGAIIVLVVCLLLGAGMVGGSMWLLEREKAEFGRHDRHFKAISQRYLSVDSEAALIKENYPRFVALYRRGTLGEERRLDWLETLRAADEEIRLPELSYQIEPREVFEPGFDLQRGPFDIYLSRMKLDLGLLHEGDLFSLLRVLEKRAQGLFTVHACELRLLHRTIEPDPTRKNIAATCELDWYTVDLAGENSIRL